MGTYVNSILHCVLGWRLYPFSFLSKLLFRVLFWESCSKKNKFGFFEHFFEQIYPIWAIYPFFEHFSEHFFEQYSTKVLFLALFGELKKVLKMLSTFLSTFWELFWEFFWDSYYDKTYFGGGKRGVKIIVWPKTNCFGKWSETARKLGGQTFLCQPEMSTVVR